MSSSLVYTRMTPSQVGPHLPQEPASLSPSCHTLFQPTGCPLTGLQALHTLLLNCSSLVRPLVDGYIWQKDALQLHSSGEHAPSWTQQRRRKGMPGMHPLGEGAEIQGGVPGMMATVCACAQELSAPPHIPSSCQPHLSAEAIVAAAPLLVCREGGRDAAGGVGGVSPAAAAAEPPCVWGAVRFGDNIEDEWFIVSLILEVTRKLPGVSAKVRIGGARDSQGGGMAGVQGTGREGAWPGYRVQAVGGHARGLGHDHGRGGHQGGHGRWWASVVVHTVQYSTA